MPTLLVVDRKRKLGSIHVRPHVRQVSQVIGFVFRPFKPLPHNVATGDTMHLLVLTRSGGPDAWCDRLRIYPDRTSVYTDDCRRVLLHNTPPPDPMQALLTLAGSIATLDLTETSGGFSQRLEIYGTGDTPPGEAEVQTAWMLADQFHNFLSKPIGLGLTLLYEYPIGLFGIDLRGLVSQPTSIEVRGTLYGTVTSTDNTLVYADDNGAHYLNVDTGQKGLLLSQPPGGGHYQPLAINSQNEFIVELYGTEADQPPELGWASVKTREWKPLPLPESGGYGCHTGTSWHPTERKLVVTGLGYGAPCNINPGMTLVDLDAGTAEPLVFWPVYTGAAEGETILSGALHPTWSPDGQWIAVALEEDATAPMEFPSRIYLLDSIGLELIDISQNATGRATHPVWAPDSHLYYKLEGADGFEDGIYAFDPETQQSALLIAGSSVIPIHVAPSGEFLIFTDSAGLNAWTFAYNQILPVAPTQNGLLPSFAGWLVAK